MEDPPQLGACINCNKQTTLVCNRCKCACYCSQECQQKDLPIHGLLCSDFANFKVTARPTEDHIRAILFPKGQRIPKITWLDCNPIGLDEYDIDARDQGPNLEPFLIPRFTIKRSFIKNNLILARKLSDTICIRYCDPNGRLYSTVDINESIENITATRPGQYFNWIGPVIAYGSVGLSPSQGKYKDLDMNDFRHVTDYFLSCGFNLALPATPCSLPRIKAVRINCVRDREMWNKPEFEQIELSANDPIFTVHDTSDILDRIGIPVFTQRCTPPPSSEVDYDSSYENPSAGFLHLNCDPKAIDWGWIPGRWSEMPGSAIIVRQDKKPLSLFHAEVFCRYCYEEVNTLMEHSAGYHGPDEYITKESVLSIICRPFFTIHRNRMIREKIDKNEEVDTTCPYNP
ncbi:hypothetical protein F4859DRAFT_524530 [Xylaria cf. heliscus]|nr:hypothetical protein F4859DRAFT_524530 [Xylaria cf. heliscus]